MEKVSTNTIIIGLFSVVFLLLLFPYFNTPTGAGVEVKGVATLVEYINPKLDHSYTRFKVKLENGNIIEAKGPPNVKPKANASVVLLKKEYYLTGGNTYEFIKYQ